MRHLLLLLAGLVPLAACTRQTSSSSNVNTAAQTISNQNAPDDVAICAAKSHSEGLYEVAGAVLAPVITNAPKASLPDEVLKSIKDQHIEKFEAISLIGMTVDVHGMPRDTCVLKEAGHGLDRNALKVASEYRFKPATLEGKPVPVRVAVELRFANFPAEPDSSGGGTGD
jgi:hypothetical protein